MSTTLFRGCFAAVAVNMSLAAYPAAASCPPDINNDNQVNAADLMAVIAAWGSCSGSCPADIAPGGGDGIVAMADLMMVITGWGPCATSCSPAQGCVLAAPIWCENFELNNYSRWTGGYDEPTSCEINGFTTSKYRSPSRSHKSEVVCSTSGSHRGYGGLKFLGDLVLPHFGSPSTGGINAPHGVVVTQWIWLESGYSFSSSRWLSLLTVTHDCSHNWNSVLTLNIDDSSMRLKPVHVSSVSYAANAPAMTMGQWTRVTTYINYATGSMHVWQNGAKVCSATFSRPSSTMCQWHFGLYASGPNDDITLYEDDLSIVKLLEPISNFNVEPRFPTLISPCGIVY